MGKRVDDEDDDFTPNPRAKAGDNRIGGIAAEALRQFVDRIERLEEERKAIAADIKDVKAQAKSQGFDVKILNMVLKIRKQDEAEREEAEQILDLYKSALGMI